jgi:putative transposase
MPWKETDVMKERSKFVLEWERRWRAGDGRVNVAELCREFGVSRDTGHRWIRRFQAADHRLDAVVGRSTRPEMMPTKVSDETEDLVVAARKAKPTYGPKKLRAMIVERYPQYPVPSPSTIGEILKRRGLSRRRRKRSRRYPMSTKPFAHVVESNTTWCVDFKGPFRTQDGRWCYPLTILDAHTRFLIRCEALLEPTGDAVRHVFDSAFQEFGLPKAIRSDNGPPFASSGAGGLTALAVWWMRLGIRPERIAPGKPQQNGRQERFHRTLKAETASPSKQRAFDLFRRDYNEDRPHEALGQRPPARFYEASRRKYPRKLSSPERYPWHQYLRVTRRGYLVWDGKYVFLSAALAYEDVELHASTDERSEHLDVYFHDVLLGRLLLSDDGWVIRQPPRPRKRNKEEKGMKNRKTKMQTAR